MQMNAWEGRSGSETLPELASGTPAATLVGVSRSDFRSPRLKIPRLALVFMPAIYPDGLDKGCLTPPVDFESAL